MNTKVTSLDSFTHATPARQAQTLLGVSFIFGLLFYWCFWNQWLGISVLIFLLLGIGMTWSFLKLIGRLWPTASWLIVGVMVFIGAMITWRGSILLAVLNVLTLFVLGLMTVWLLRGESWRMSVSGFALLALLPLAWIRPFFTTVGRSWAFGSAEIASQKSSATVKGIVLTVPVVVVLLFLFIKSDALLGTFFDGLFTWTFSEETVMSWVVILLVSVWFAGALSFIFHKAHHITRTITDKRLVGVLESQIMLTGVNTVFALFLLAQFAYLFGGAAYLDQAAVSYADYARQGFGELVIVALIAVGVIWFTRPYISAKSAPLLRNLGLGLGVQVLLVLFSAMNRLWLYEQAYGFTVARLISHTFMIWLAVVFVILLLQIKDVIGAKTVGPIIIASAILAVVSLNVLSPDAFIAGRNVARYHNTGKIDLDYLNSLSSDAVPALLPLLQVTDATLRNEVARGLGHRLVASDTAVVNSQTDWRSWNWSRYNGTLQLQQHEQDLNYENNKNSPPSKYSWQD